jgi:hypothetical protein
MTRAERSGLIALIAFTVGCLARIVWLWLQ